MEARASRVWRSSGDGMRLPFIRFLNIRYFVIFEGVQMGSTSLEGVKEQGKRGEQSFLDSPLGADAK